MNKNDWILVVLNPPEAYSIKSNCNPKQAIGRVHYLAGKEKRPKMKENCMLFEWVPEVPIGFHTDILWSMMKWMRINSIKKQVIENDEQRLAEEIKNDQQNYVSDDEEDNAAQ